MTVSNPLFKVVPKTGQILIDHFPLTPDTHLYESVPITAYVPVDKPMFEHREADTSPEAMIAFAEHMVREITWYPPLPDMPLSRGFVRVKLQDGLGSVEDRTFAEAMRAAMVKVAQDPNPEFTRGLYRRLKDEIL